jgi:hypothetical protein
MTHTDTWDRNLDNGRRRNKHAQKMKGDCKENIWTHKRIRLDHTNKQGDNQHITRVRYYKVIKFL